MGATEGGSVSRSRSRPCRVKTARSRVWIALPSRSERGQTVASPAAQAVERVTSPNHAHLLARLLKLGVAPQERKRKTEEARENAMSENPQCSSINILRISRQESDATQRSLQTSATP